MSRGNWVSVIPVWQHRNGTERKGVARADDRRMPVVRAAVLGGGVRPGAPGRPAFPGGLVLVVVLGDGWPVAWWRVGRCNAVLRRGATRGCVVGLTRHYVAGSGGGWACCTRLRRLAGLGGSRPSRRAARPAWCRVPLVRCRGGSGGRPGRPSGRPAAARRGRPARRPRRPPGCPAAPVSAVWPARCRALLRLALAAVLAAAPWFGVRFGVATQGISWVAWKGGRRVGMEGRRPLFFVPGFVLCRCT